MSTADNPFEWLAHNLGGAACIVYKAGPSALQLEQVEENTEVQFHGCRMVLQQASGNGQYSQVQTFDIDLAALDAEAISMREWSDLSAGWMTAGDVPTHTITLTAPESQPPFESTVETFTGRAPMAVQTRTVDIQVRHQESAQQIVQALRLAVATCRLPHP